MSEDLQKTWSELVRRSKRLVDHASIELKEQPIYKNSRATVWANDQLSKQPIIKSVDYASGKDETVVSFFIKEGYYTIEDLKEFIEKAEDYTE